MIGAFRVGVSKICVKPAIMLPN